MRIALLPCSSLFAATVLAACLPPDNTDEVTPPAQPTEVDLLVQPLLDDEWTVGMVVGLLHPDGSTEIFPYGKVSPSGAATDASTLFEIASISKTFTSLALADMVVEGTVTLEQPVQELLPDAQVTMLINQEPITLQHLSTHTSGLPRLPGNFQPADLMDPYADYSVDDLYAFLNAHTPTAAPGARWEYSNLAVGLLGHALSLSDGSSWEQSIATRITEPLGMTDTIATLTSEQRARAAQGHDGNLDPIPLWNHNVLAGAHALLSNATDMLAYIAAQAGHGSSTLTPAMELSHESRYRISSSQEIGLAWFVDETRYIWHNGLSIGFGSFIGFDAQTQAGVVVLNNTLTPYAVETTLGQQLLRLVAGEPHSAPDIPPTLQLTAQQLERYAGDFVPASGGGFTIALRDGALFLELPGQNPHRMFATEQDVFYLRIAAATLSYGCVEAVCDSMVYEQAGVPSFSLTRVP